MQELTYEARRLYRREIATFVMLGIILGAVNVAVQGVWSTIMVLCSSLTFLIALVFFGLARWWIKPLSFGSESVKYGTRELSVNKLSGIEFRPNRNWLIITLKSGVIPHIRLLQLIQQKCNSSELDELRSWALAHNLTFHQF